MKIGAVGFVTDEAVRPSFRTDFAEIAEIATFSLYQIGFSSTMYTKISKVPEPFSGIQTGLLDVRTGCITCWYRRIFPNSTI